MQQTAAAPGSAADNIPFLLTSAVQALSQTVFLILLIGAKGKFREFGMSRPKPADVLRAGASFAVFFIAGLLGSILISLTGTIGMPETMQTGAASSGIGPLLAYLAASMLFSLAIGYREELIYRVYTIGALRENGVSPIITLMVSAMLFTAGHAYQGAPGLLGAGAAGIVLAACALRGFGLHALAWGHVAYDFFVLITRL